MKKVSGGNFGVRFFRRGVAKDAPSVTKGAAMNDMDIPVQTEDDTAPLPPISSAARAAPTPLPEKERSLRAAAKAGDCHVIRVLVMEGVDLDARDEQGRTALNIATQYNQKNAIKTLLAAREMRRMAMRGELPDTQFFSKFKRNGQEKI